MPAQKFPTPLRFRLMAKTALCWEFLRFQTEPAGAGLRFGDAAGWMLRRFLCGQWSKKGHPYGCPFYLFWVELNRDIAIICSDGERLAALVLGGGQIAIALFDAAIDGVLLVAA